MYCSYQETLNVKKIVAGVYKNLNNSSMPDEFKTLKNNHSGNYNCETIIFFTFFNCERIVESSYFWFTIYFT